jgi:hypothetical protein
MHLSAHVHLARACRYYIGILGYGVNNATFTLTVSAQVHLPSLPAELPGQFYFYVTLLLSCHQVAGGNASVVLSDAVPQAGIAQPHSMAYFTYQMPSSDVGVDIQVRIAACKYSGMHGWRSRGRLST